MRRRSKELRALAARGMKPKAYRAEADKIDAALAKMEARPPRVEGVRTPPSTGGVGFSTEPPPVEKAEKQPWEMTKEEFRQKWHKDYRNALDRVKAREDRELVSLKTKQAGLAAGMTLDDIADNLVAQNSESIDKAHASLTQQAAAGGKIQGYARDAAKTHPVPRHVLEDYRGEKWADEALGEKPAEVKKGKPAPEPTTASQYRQRIRAIVAKKGLPQTEWRAVAKKYGDRKHLASITDTAKLEAVLNAMQRARPKRVGQKTVVTQKTESKISKLYQRLRSRDEITPGDFGRMVDQMRLRASRYVDATTFITERQGRELIRKMNDEAPLIKKRLADEKAVNQKGNEGIAANISGLNKSIERKRVKEGRKARLVKTSPFRSMRYYAMEAQVKTGLPFSDAWEEMNERHLEVQDDIDRHHRTIEESTPESKRIAKDKAALQRVSDYIASKLPGKPQRAYPKDISAEEIKYAQAVEKVLEGFKDMVRLARFMDYYHEQVEIPDAPAEDLTKATDIYESEGLDALKVYLKGRKWGVIERGYEPTEISRGKSKIRGYKFVAFGKGHLKTREARPGLQERTILQRVDSYMRQILNKVKLEPAARAYIRLHDDNTEAFAEPGRVAEDVALAVNEAKGFPESGGPLPRASRRIAAQAFRAIFLKPVMTIRNLFQNLAFNEDFSLAVLVDPRNKALTPQDMEYFDTRVDQSRQMRRQYLMQEERPVHPFKTISKLADKVSYYHLGDKVNRLWAFWGRINRVRRAMADVDVSDLASAKKMMDKAGFASLEESQQKQALTILAADGKDAMARYVAGAHTMNVHFAYERAQRSPAEMGAMGRTLGSLLAFPRSWAERYYLEARKVKRGGTYTARHRAFGRLLQMSIGGMLAGHVFMVLTGRKRNPYNPLNILTWGPGGLVLGAPDELSRAMYHLTRALMGDRRALGQLTGTIPRLAQMFVPFYDQIRNITQALTGTKNIDRRALREIRSELDDNYKLRRSAYKADRELVDAFRHGLFGTEPEKPKKPKPKKKK